MGNKNASEVILDDAADISANYNSDPIDITNKKDIIGINIATSGITDNTGTFYIDHRMYDDKKRVGSAWAELTLVGGNPVLADANDVILVALTTLPKGQIRIRFVVAGSVPDGAAIIWVSTKEV